MDLREATITDLDSVTEIALASFPLDPQWNYRFPHRYEFPEDTRKYTEIGYKAFFEAKGAFCVMVAMAPSLEDPRVIKPVAMAVWEITNLKKPEAEVPSIGELAVNPLDDGLGIRRDAHPGRMKAFTNSMKAARRQYFEDVYGVDQIYLKILATHPDYRRRGAGAKLCSWGIELAEKNQTHISVFASPMGKNLYTRLGFKELAVVVVQVEGEEEKVSIPAMLYTSGHKKDPWCSIT